MFTRIGKHIWKSLFYLHCSVNTHIERRASKGCYSILSECNISFLRISLSQVTSIIQHLFFYNYPIFGFCIDAFYCRVEGAKYTMTYVKFALNSFFQYSENARYWEKETVLVSMFGMNNKYSCNWFWKSISIVMLCVFQMIFKNIKKENLAVALNYIDIHHIIAWGLRFDKRCSTSCKKLIHVIYLGIQVSPSFHTIMKQAVWSEYASMTAKSIVIYVIEARLLLPLCNTWFTSPFL